MAGASRIIAVDMNPGKFVSTVELSATDYVDSSKLDTLVQLYIAGDFTPWGVDSTTVRSIYRYISRLIDSSNDNDISID